MISEVLTPNLALLSEEYLLVQAWKKTSAYIRYHNWYSDTLELDRTTVNLPEFLENLSKQLRNPEVWQSEPLRIVPAPKSQKWVVQSGVWGLENNGEPPEGSRLRPLAHVSLRDQVAATAIMLCLADRVETLQGDPRERINTPEARRRTLSYGNRLFCDNEGDALRHRWGSGKLYRAYFQDYRSFVSRPEVVSEGHTCTTGNRIVVVHSDLRQFYDRVNPLLLAGRVEGLMTSEDDPRFFAFAKRVLNWTWDPKDDSEVEKYCRQANLSDFSSVALPQGLVASGFFSNVVLLNLDDALRSLISQEICSGLRLVDACRYVDDLRFVVEAEESLKPDEIEKRVIKWLTDLLKEKAPGLEPSEDKTRAALFSGDERPLVRQSRKMARIQAAVSGGFDAVGGEEILNALLGLVQTQNRYGDGGVGKQGWALSPIPDVQDATVARFAAARFRSTFRSLRPLLSGPTEEMNQGDEIHGDEVGFRSRQLRSQVELDEDARTYAFGLIEAWIHDPSNVRLLRIALDLWPDKDVLRHILVLLRPFTANAGLEEASRRVAWYCLAEIFRAGATETGHVEAQESLPDGIDLEGYREILQKEGVRLLSGADSELPWYLNQQILLFLASHGRDLDPNRNFGVEDETKHYRELIQFLCGEIPHTNNAEIATFAILARRSYLDRDRAIKRLQPGLTTGTLEAVASKDPSFALELIQANEDLEIAVSDRMRNDLCLVASNPRHEGISLASVVLARGADNPLRNEVSLLQFSALFLKELIDCQEDVVVLTPTEVFLNMDLRTNEVLKVWIEPSRVNPENSFYTCPDWCPLSQRWRLQLGFLLRFILTAQQDFTKVVRLPDWKVGRAYQAPDSHWYQRVYGFFNGQSAFGDDWLPISSWFEEFLSALLKWPGSRSPSGMDNVGIESLATATVIEERLKVLDNLRGKNADPMLLPLRAPWPTKEHQTRPMRACVVQLVPPELNAKDLVASDSATRKQHRNHLSAALAAVERMLDLRETHLERKGRLDWLILPELSVHPDDVKTHLIPFARAYKTIVLAGLSYQDLGLPSRLLVNSALWVIPAWTASHGLHMVTRRQGKWHLAPNEQGFNDPVPQIAKFRPCQWLIGYEWSGATEDCPLYLTASICYDATDLSLASTLRHHSDVYAIPAWNRDVGTFDQMSLALHYHMFQMVIVANNGKYGGSSAYAPYKNSFKKQVFHLHGQPQASVAFLEIEDIGHFLSRKIDARISVSEDDEGERIQTPYKWKAPPAGI